MRKTAFASVTISEFAALVRRSRLMTDILLHFGLSPKGTGNYTTLKTYMRLHDIDCSHLIANRRVEQTRHLCRRHIPTDTMCTINSTYSRGVIKRRGLQEGWLTNACAICKLTNTWQGRQLVLVLDHINGVYDDNRKENLRLLCPNCNSQQSTFGARNKIRHVNVKRICPSCGNRKLSASKLCRPCSDKARRLHG
jgi:hypothetical protein